ncbi:hypothetical protein CHINAEXTREME_09845 [Halobiforma lacisalsi AJ5]|uniref:Uncharacterized protein n=1 Tax=Natronobacterium lacisalsi AJ5 TaxID=358396 RepID=M0L832_NATLA|nr:hypothetical protein [Halobiforma lacisalsi]APW98068.1 hypothetical protein CHINAEXTREME_09845 [Halobiforma lacisalsi AJ5]EMA28624.1 hypothetical protein C445_18416 [Halobiforma lacisalsi AJ5]
MLDRKIDVEPYVTHLMVAGAALWLGSLLLGVAGYWFEALLVTVFVFHPYFVVGAAHDHEISLKLLVYPLGVFTVLGLAGFGGAQYYSEAFMGQTPEFLITGMHPSFAAVFWLYWIGGFMSVNLAYGLFYREHFLPDGAWDEFLAELEAIEDEETAASESASEPVAEATEVN